MRGIAVTARRFVCCAAGVLTAGALATGSFAAQDAPRPSAPPERYTVTIEGCIRGGRLEPTAHSASRAQSSALAVAEFQLRGERATMRILREEHDGHQDEITGVVETPRDPRTRTGVATKEVGKGRIFVGRRQARTLPELDAGARTATLRVESIRHLSDRCHD